MNINPSWFSLFKNNDNINEGISEDFIAILKKCKNPHIICIYGDARTGKSTKMNQIINGTKSSNYFDLKGPFKTLREIHTTMTKGCNFYGPIKAGDIADMNNIDKCECKDILNDELFFVDTEGLNTIDDTTKSCVSGILTILQIAAIKILYTPLLDNEKLEDAVNNTKLSNILDVFVNESKIIVLIRDVPLKEKNNERRMFTELDHQKIIFETKINGYFRKIDENTEATCEILPSFDLAADKDGPIRECYKAQMENLVLSILTNIKPNKDMNGEKLIGIIKEFLDIFKKIKNIEKFKNTKNALSSILSEIFNEKISKVYSNLLERVKKYDTEIIRLNGKSDLIKNYLVEKLKHELKNTYEIYEKALQDEMKKQLDFFGLKLEGDIKSIFNEEENKIEKEKYKIIDIKNHKEIMNYFTNISFKEEINKNKIKSIVQKIIDKFMNEHKLYFENMDLIDKNYKNKMIKYINEGLDNNINYLIDLKPSWNDYLRKIIFEIQTKLAYPYKNELKKKSKEEMDFHIKNNCAQLAIKIQTYLAEQRIKAYKEKDLLDEINKIYESIKEELSIQIEVLQGKKKIEELEKHKLSSRSIPDGQYCIFYKNKALDICGANQNNNAQLILFSPHNGNNQKFEIKYDTFNKYYTIKSLCSDKFITCEKIACGNSKQKVFQFEPQNNEQQQWHIVSVGDYYEIISKLNKKLLGISGQVQDNIQMELLDRNNESNHLFEFKATTKNLPPPPPPPPPPQPTPPSVVYFPIPDFHYPYTDRNSIVDALKSIGVDHRINYRIIIGNRNGIQGNPGSPSYNLAMLALLKQGKLIKP